MVCFFDRAAPMTPTFGGTYCRPSQCGGSRIWCYSTTVGEVAGGNLGLTGKLHSISAMPCYNNKSTEELRWEDYHSGDKGGIGFAAWASRPNLLTGSGLPAQPASNAFSSSTSANLFASQTPASYSLCASQPRAFSSLFASQPPASASAGLGESTTPAFSSSLFAGPSSLSPFGPSSSNPFPSDFGASSAPAISSSPFQASACPSTAKSSFTPHVWGTAKASGFGGRSFEPSFGASSLPMFGSSTCSCCSNPFGATSSQPTFGANNSPPSLFGEPTSSIPSTFGSVPPNTVSPPSFGLFPMSQFVAPSFGANDVFSSTPGRIASLCPSITSSTPFTGNGSEGNLFSSKQFACPPYLAGFGPTTYVPAPFQPVLTAHRTGVPVGNFGQIVAGLPCWIPFGHTVASPPGWVAFAQPIAAPVTFHNPYYGEGAGPMTPIFGSTNFGQSAFGCQCGGSRVAAYTTPMDEVDGRTAEFTSVMPKYENKSPEEIRWADYLSGKKCGPKGVGQFVVWAPDPFAARRFTGWPTPSPFSSSDPFAARRFTGWPTPSPFSSSDPFASEKPPFFYRGRGVPTTPLFGSSVFAAPSSACPGQSFASPLSSNSSNFFSSKAPVFASADSVVSSETPASPSAGFRASTTPFGSPVLAAPSSPSPIGQSSANPSSLSTPSISFAPKTQAFGSSGFEASTAPALSSSPFHASACPSTARSSSVPYIFAKASACGSEPSLGASSLPTCGSWPSVFSSSSSFLANPFVTTSSQPILATGPTPVLEAKSSPSLFGAPSSSISSTFGSALPNNVPPSLFGPITAQSPLSQPLSQSAEPSIGQTNAVSGQFHFSFTPKIATSIGTSAGTGSGGNSFTSVQCAFPTTSTGSDSAISTTTPFQPVRRADSVAFHTGNFGQSVAGSNDFSWLARHPGWSAFG